MGKSILKKMVVFVVAAALVISSGVGVYAAGPSSQVGAVKSLNSTESYTKRCVTITWAKVSKATKYKVYKNGKLVATVKGTKYVLKKLKAGEKYTLAIAAVAPDGKTIGKKTTIKANSASKRWMKPVKMKKVKAGKKKATVTWKKVSGATGYQILYSKDKKTWKSKFVKGGKKTSTTIKKLSKGKWFFKVRPVKSGYLGVRTVSYSCKVK